MLPLQETSRLGPRRPGLPKASVVNVSQILTIDRSLLDGCIGTLSAAELHELDDGLRLALGL